MCGGFTCSKNTLVGLNIAYILVSFIMIGVAVHGKLPSIFIVTSFGVIWLKLRLGSYHRKYEGLEMVIG